MDEDAPPSDPVPFTFEQALLPHRDAAYNLARWLMRETHEAEDCVQDSYLRAYRSFGTFRGGDGKAWLLTIVRNVCYSRLRSKQRAGAETVFDETLHADAVDEPTPTVWRSSDLRALVPQALENLPNEYREILALHAVEGLSYKELSAVIGVPMGTVMSRLSRARSRLQTELQRLSRKEARHDL